MDIKPGTKVETVVGHREAAVVCRWNRRINGERMDGWYLVRFSDNQQVVMHGSRFHIA